MSFDRLVLFDNHSTDTVSETFTVWDGRYYVIRAWGFSKQTYNHDNKAFEGKNQRATVQSVLCEDAPVPNGTLCMRDIVVKTGEEIAVEDVTQCGVWFLDACQNTVILSLPGSYKIELNDPAAVGEVYMVMYAIPYEKALLNRELNLSHID